jgi:hypothetical protein
MEFSPNPLYLLERYRCRFRSSASGLGVRRFESLTLNRPDLRTPDSFASHSGIGFILAIPASRRGFRAHGQRSAKQKGIARFSHGRGLRVAIRC